MQYGGPSETISEYYKLPELFELWIDYLDTENEQWISLFARHTQPIDGLYINYKVDDDYKRTKVWIDPYFDGLLNVIQHVKDRSDCNFLKENISALAL